ncbi:hypothetical protein LguiB_001897 [Lonicera macranthoides]
MLFLLCRLSLSQPSLTHLCLSHSSLPLSHYSCRTATETLEWIHAIIDFIKPHTFFIEAHVVNFFKETVDKEWIDSLRNESVENLLQISSGVVQIEALSAVVWSIARGVGASTTIDVGAGQSSLQNNNCDLQINAELESSKHVSSEVVNISNFEILHRWYNNVARGHMKWVVDVCMNWDNVLENVSWSYWALGLVAFDLVWIWIGLVWFSGCFGSD